MAIVALSLLGACTGGSIDVEEMRVEQSSTTSIATTISTRGISTTSTAGRVSEGGPIEPAEAFTPTTTAPGPVEVALARLTIEQKVGQLVMAAVWGTDANTVAPRDLAPNQGIGRVNTPAEMVAAQGLGGVVLLRRNVVDGSQVANLSAGLQAAAAPSGIGLLIAVDQEGGRVTRIRNGATTFPSARELAGDAGAVRAAAAVTAAEMRSFGINVVLAPVADLTDSHEGIIGDRAYGADPRLVSEMVVAAIDGLQAGDGTNPGAAAAVKHWPGHGATDIDSHQSLPVIGVDEPTWRERERVPFAAAVAAGVDIVLVGHLALPAIDPTGEPATVSTLLLDGQLRQQLGFQGVVMTDALDMGAVGGYERGELAVRAVLAGADLLLAPPDVQLTREALVNAVASGRISLERIDASVERILRLKQRLGVPVG